MSPTVPLTQADVVALAEVINSVGKKVRWAIQGGEVMEGTSRHIVRDTENYGFLRAQDDIRDAYLRITTAGGFDIAPRVLDVMAMVQRNEFVVD